MVKENTKVTLNPIVWTMFISLILDLMGFTVILPLMPKILDHYHSQGSTSIGAIQSTIQNLQERFNIPDKFTSVLTGGVLGSLFSFLQFLTAPLAGSLSDCYGRKPALLISMVGIAASYALWVIADNFFLFVLARAVGGLSKANVSLATAVMADVTDTSTRTKAMVHISAP